MTLRFASLGSGSRGHGLVVEAGTSRVLLDCGFTPRDCERRLARLGLAPSELAGGPYPGWLKQRIGGPFGHLANDAAAELLAMIDTRRLRHVVAAHLSESNNTPALARAALAGVLGCAADWIGVASQESGFDWRGL